MDLPTLSSKYGDFYAPAFAVKLRGKDVVRDLLLAVSQAEVDLVLGGTAHFTFTIVDAYDIEAGTFLTGRNEAALELLTFGADVDICMGYGDQKTVPVVLQGMITEISTTFPESGSPELVISGHDRAYPLTLGKKTFTWAKRSDSDAVSTIASYSNLGTDIEATPEHRNQIEQNQQSDFEFMLKLAGNNHYELFVDEASKLHFHKPHDKPSEVLTLEWGKGLLSFKPQANLAGQVSKVEIHGWDLAQKKPIVGIARAGEESGLRARAKSAGQRLSSLVRDPAKQPVLRLRQPVFTQSEADQRAKATLNDKAKDFLTGDAESIGVPEIRPDRNVRLDGLGDPFSTVYYVQQATHRVDASGYRTRFKVKDPGL
jgi:phage protein D